MGHILIPTDFSQNSVNALNYGLRLAELAGDEITVLHVFKSPSELTESELLQDFDIPKERMEQLMAELPAAQTVVHHQIIEGDTVMTIAELTRSGIYSLLVMGTKGASGIAEQLFGSITAQIIDHTAIPLLVIPEKANFKRPRKMGFAISFSPEDIAAIEALKDICSRWEMSLVCVHVAFDKLEMLEAQGKIEVLQNTFWYAPMNVLSFEVVINEDVEDGITEFANDYSVDIMAIMPKKRTFIEKLFRTSISKKLAFHSHSPLLFIKP